MHTITEAARELDVHPDTLRRLEREGAFLPVRTRGGARRYGPHDVETLRRLLYSQPVADPTTTTPTPNGDAGNLA